MSPVLRLAGLLTSAFLAAAGSACRNEATVVDVQTPPQTSGGLLAGTLEATANRPNLILRNTTEFVVGYMVVDKEQMVVALYPPCGAQCPKLAQGEQLMLPYTSIGGYTAKSTEAVVMWWTYVRGADNTLQPSGAVQTRHVRL